MKLGALIQQLVLIERAHGDLDVYTRDVMSGIMGAVIPQCSARVATLAKITGRQRKRRLHNTAYKESGEAGEAVVIL